MRLIYLTRLCPFCSMLLCSGWKMYCDSKWTVDDIHYHVHSAKLHPPFIHALCWAHTQSRRLESLQKFRKKSDSRRDAGSGEAWRNLSSSDTDSLGFIRQFIAVHPVFSSLSFLISMKSRSTTLEGVFSSAAEHDGRVQTWKLRLNPSIHTMLSKNNRMNGVIEISGKLGWSVWRSNCGNCWR